MLALGRRIGVVAAVAVALVATSAPGWAATKPLSLVTTDPTPGGEVAGEVVTGPCRVELTGEVIDREPGDWYIAKAWVRVTACGGGTFWGPLGGAGGATPVPFEHRYNGFTNAVVQVCLHRWNTLNDRSKGEYCSPI